MIAVPRSHLLHKQFPARRARLFISRRSPHAKIPIRRTSVGGCGMGHFHAEGDCVSRSRGGMAKAGVGGDQSSREGGGRKDGCRLGVVGQNERKAAQRGHYPAGLLVHARMNECPCLEEGRWALLCKVSRNTLLSGRYGSLELIEFVRASLPQATSV
jgi:hypothetical protein